VREQIAGNKRKTILLVIGAVVFACVVGYVLGLVISNGSTTAAIGALVVALLLSLAMSWGSYRYGDRIVLSSSHARAVSAAEEPRLHNVVEGLALAAGLPKPAVYVVPEQSPNAFATGRDPEHSSIAVTQGLLDMMNRVELEGVIGHEMSHVRDRDILLGTVVATLVGAGVLLAEFMLRWYWWSGMTGGRSRDNGGNQGNVILFAIGIVLAILAPIFAQIIKMAMSRRREYLADAEGAMLTRYPPGLASALRKVAGDHTPMRTANNATAHLWLNQPSRTPGEENHWFENLFSTHPPIQDRIKRLEEM
jgi:heat shock protein HtpX